MRRLSSLVTCRHGEIDLARVIAALELVLAALNVLDAIREASSADLLASGESLHIQSCYRGALGRRCDPSMRKASWDATLWEDFRASRDEGWCGQNSACLHALWQCACAGFRVGSHAVRGCSREREHGNACSACSVPKPAEIAVVAAKVMSPLRDTVCFIHSEQHELARSCQFVDDAVQEGGRRAQEFRGDVDDAVVSVENAPLGGCV